MSSGNRGPIFVLGPVCDPAFRLVGFVSMIVRVVPEGNDGKLNSEGCFVSEDY